MSGALLSPETLTATRRSARRVATPLRPLWEAYQKAWKAVSDAGDEEDAAMQARPKGAPQGSTQPEKDAKEKMALASKAFAAATEAFATAPTRTVDDAVCRIEYALDQDLDSDVQDALKAAVRVLRKIRVDAIHV